MRERIGIFLICMMLVTSCITIVFPVETVKASENTFYSTDDTFISKLDNQRLLVNDIEIIEFEPNLPNDVQFGFGSENHYDGSIKFRNNGFFPVKAMYTVDFYNENNTVIQYGSKNQLLIIPERWRSNSILSKIVNIFANNLLEKSSDWDYQFNEWQDVDYIRINLYKKIPFFGWILSDSLDYLTLICKQKLDKNKVRILEVISPEILEENQKEFEVNVTVINEGNVFQEVWLRIDKISGSQIFEDSDVFNLNKIIYAEKELGRSNEKDIHDSGGKEKFNINCVLRKADSFDEYIHIEANLFIKIGGRQYKIDSSLIQTIYHEKPSYQNNEYFLFILIMIVISISILLSIYFIKLHNKNKLKRN